MTHTQLAQLCRESYVGGPEFMDVGDLRYGIFNVDGFLTVVFRGSANALNWLRDFNVGPRLTMHDHLAHGGFLSAFEELWPQLKDIGPNVYVTGHSLGAAIAVLFAEALGCPVVTFGCPRVYSRLSSEPELLHSRIICDDDPVPMLPALTYSWRNAATLVLKDDDGELVNPEDHNIDVYLSRLKGL